MATRDPNSPRPSLNVTRRHSNQAPIRAPTITHHSSHSLSLHSPDFLNPIASGAHYAGGIASSPKHPNKGHKQRTLSLSGDDPSVEEVYRDVLKDIEDLFCAAATAEVFERRFRHNAEYEDPLCKCKGITECVAQFVALSKLCSSSKRISCRVVSATLKPNRLVLAQTQEYKLRWIGSKKLVSSFLLVDLDDDFKIVKMVDEWDGEKPPTRWGALQLRRLNAKAMPLFIRMPHAHSA